MFAENATKSWESYVASDIRLRRDFDSADSSKRETRLKKLLKKQLQDKETLAKFDAKTSSWKLEIQNIEAARIQRHRANSQNVKLFVEADWQKVLAELQRERSLWGEETDPKSRWKLDFVESKVL